MLFGIIGARRKQVLSSIGVEEKLFKEDKAVLLSNKTIKHCNLNRPLDPLLCHRYSENINIL